MKVLKPDYLVPNDASRLGKILTYPGPLLRGCPSALTVAARIVIYEWRRYTRILCSL